MTHLKLNLLGGLGIARNGVPVIGKPHHKARVLLAYLAMGGRPQAREALGHFFWPGAAQDAARNNLRQSVFQLRQALGNHLVLATYDAVQLDHDNIELDVTEFCVVPSSCPTPLVPAHCASCLVQMERRIGLYRGPFLDGMTFDNAPEFENWLCIKREALHRHALGLLQRLSECHERHNDLARALQFAHRHLELEPWDEAGHRRVIRLLALVGQTGAALAQFEACERMLHQELDALPDAQTLELVSRIKAGALPPPATPGPARDGMVERRRGNRGAHGAVITPERRQVTALYCSLSCALNADSEEMVALVVQTRRSSCELIRQMGGHVAQLHGGAILAYFGYPLADEQAALRAVRAALALHALSGAVLQIRVGLHTGMIVSDAELPDTMGLTSNHAIRLRDLDVPVVMSESTLRLTEGYFQVQALGLQTLRDIAQPVPAFAVLRESGATHRLQASLQHGTGLTPFVGRATELKTLRTLWKQVQQAPATSRLAMVRGEAGMGKSRLVHTLCERLKGSTCSVRELRCFPESSQSAFHPLIVLLKTACGFESTDTPQVKRHKLTQYFSAGYADLDAQAVALLAQLLSVSGDESTSLSPQEQRQKITTIVLDVLRMLAARQPLLLLIKDVHWMDPSTLELLTRFATGESLGPILTVLTARPEFELPWPDSAVTTITLHALAPKAVASMLAYWGADIPAEIQERILHRADGVPLFVEEMVKVAREGSHEIPPTLHDLLAVKLDDLGASKGTAQLAASIGREFDIDLLRQISPPSPPLEPALAQLQNAGLIVPGTGKVYQFKHFLMQEAAYRSQIKAARQTAHRSIARALPLLFADQVNTQPEIMAQHLSAAGETQQALDYWLQAATRASQRSANTEAIAHFRAGLHLIAQLPADAWRDSQEFALQVGLGTVLHAAQGYGLEPASAAFQRAMTLCGNAASPEFFQTLWGVWVGMMNHFPSADGFAQKLLHLAQQINDPVLLVQAHYVMSNNQFFLGRFESAHAHAELALSFYKPDHHERLILSFGENSAVTSGVFLSWALWFKGLPDQAQHASAQAIALARQAVHPHSLAFALSGGATLNRWIGNSQATLALSTEAMDLASRHNFPVWMAAAMVMQGWALTKQGHKEALEQIKQSIVAMRASMNALTIIFLSILADACLIWEDHQAALEAVDEALEAQEVIGDCHFEAELYRLRGECLQGFSIGSDAKNCFEKALTISRRHGAKPLELRAAMSLARHFNDMNPLSGVCNGFTEGLDTADLVEARVLLGRI